MRPMQPWTGLYRKSDFIQIVENDIGAVIWHSLFGKPRQATSDTVAFLGYFSTPVAPASVVEDLALDAESQAAVGELIVDYFIVPVDVNERKLLQEITEKRMPSVATGSRVDNLSLIISESCNFLCKYCIHSRNLKSTHRASANVKQMSVDVATLAVDSFLQVLRRTGKKAAEINFGGGEPLLGWNTIAETLNYCRSEYQEEFDFKFSLNSNLSLMTLEIARVLRDFEVEISTSLDGERDSNDSVRIFGNGKGTYNRVVRGIKTVEDCGHRVRSLAVTIDNSNFDLVDESILDFAKAHGITSVRVDVDVLGATERSIGQIINKIQQFRHCGARSGIEVPGFWLRPAENLSESVLNEEVAFCGAARGNSLCVSPSGEVFACGYTKTSLGHVSGLESILSPDGAYSRLVTRRTVGREPKCHGCCIEGQCAGGCEVTREFSDFNPRGLERMCDFYKAMTRELIAEELSDSLHLTTSTGDPNDE